MADSLKVFKNTNQTPAASNSALSIPVLTTNAGETAVIKDIRLEKKNLTAEDLGFYNYPAVLKIDGNAITDPVNLTSNTSVNIPLELTGSQIVDSSSSVTLEIAAEAAVTNYGKARLFYGDGSNNSVKQSFYSHASINPKDADASAVATTIESNETIISGSYSSINGRTGTIRESNGELKIFIADSGGVLRILDINGNQIVQNNWSCYGIAVDDTYVYGTTTTNNNQLKRFNHITNTAASDLTTSRNQYFASSNPGFIEYYNGFVYIKPTGSSGDIEKINVSNGSATWFSSPVNQSEFLGAVITVNNNGLPILYMHGDTSTAARVLTTGITYYSTSIFPTNPTTTYGSGVVCIGNGLVLVDNADYNQRMIVDLNTLVDDAASGGIQQTLVTSDVSLRNGSQQILVGSEFKNTVAPVARNLDYYLLASGVLTTP